MLGSSLQREMDLKRIFEAMATAFLFEEHQPCVVPIETHHVYKGQRAKGKYH